MSAPRRTIPILPQGADDVTLDACSGAEPFALMVLGDSMAPEFAEGEIIIIEPEGLAQDGSFVLAQVSGEYIFRQLRERDGRWRLEALDPRYPALDIPDLGAVKGVVIQKQKPGARRSRKSYLPPRH
ncbi:MAG TPA: S24 family peptidase [Burkholderiales bacterium]|nr:S24 family peptidase [Burkholderiales bacterium]